MLSNGIEYIHCNLCGGDKTRLLYQVPVLAHQIGQYNRDNWDIVQCQNCGLIYENPRPDWKALDTFYSFANPGDMAYVKDWFIGNEDLNRKNWLQILRAIARFQAPGKLFDIGCGAGSFLVEARNLGYDVLGQEISPFFIDYCRQQQDLDVLAGSLESLELEENSFDCVTAFDVIEHHPDPNRLLNEMRRIVKPNGLVVVGTHDIGNYFARIYGPKWRQLYAIGHLTYFTKLTLSELLEKNNLRIIHQGGSHTIDGSILKELLNYVTKFFRLVIFRGLVIGLYRPITSKFPGLTHWSIKLENARLDHDKLMIRAGNQIVMNDSMVFLAKSTGSTRTKV